MAMTPSPSQRRKAMRGGKRRDSAQPIVQRESIGPYSARSPISAAARASPGHAAVKARFTLRPEERRNSVHQTAEPKVMPTRGRHAFCCPLPTGEVFGGSQGPENTRRACDSPPKCGMLREEARRDQVRAGVLPFLKDGTGPITVRLEVGCGVRETVTGEEISPS